MRIAEATRGVAVAERCAVERRDGAAGREQHGMTGGGVPFHGRAEARVDVGGAAGDGAEFQRRAGVGAFGDTVAAEERFSLGVAVGSAGERAQC